MQLSRLESADSAEPMWTMLSVQVPRLSVNVLRIFLEEQKTAVMLRRSRQHRAVHERAVAQQLNALPHRRFFILAPAGKSLTISGRVLDDFTFRDD
jgi:hypothetical protein